MRWMLALMMTAAPALADGCHDLWFTRNLVMDRAGYCFGSVLGQAQFDNRDCIGKNVSLAPEWSAFVQHIRSLEHQHNCRVDTSQTRLDLIDAWVRRDLWSLPVRDEFESACLGYLGTPVPLHAGYAPDTPVIGQIMPGDWVSFAHWPVNNWTYVTTHVPNDWGLKAGGWIFIPTELPCANYAG